MRGAPAARLRGVIAASPTPLRDDLTIDFDRLIEHCAWLLGPGGCDGVNLLGTTGEATSFSLKARLAAMHAVASAGIPLHRVMVGTGAAALAEAVELTMAARDLGYAGALLLPPFYYKNIDQESVLAYVRAVIVRAGSDGLRLYLYHFPQNSGVPYAIDTVAQLRDQFPDTLVGLKDSSGDPAYSSELARRLAGFDVFPGSEAALAQARRFGFAGCISATANVTAPLAQSFWRGQDSADGKRTLADAVAIRDVLGRHHFVTTVKWALADRKVDPGWLRVLPPLRQLGKEEQQALSLALAATAYRSTVQES